MGNFEAHIKHGHRAFILSAVLLVSVVFWFSLRPSLALGLLTGVYVFSLVGSVFPDVDHHASRPHHVFKKIVFSGCTVGSFYVLYTTVVQPLTTQPEITPQLIVSPELYAVGAVILSLGVGFIGQGVVKWYKPKHRGITHHVTTGLVVTGFTFFSTWSLSTMGDVNHARIIASLLSVSFFVGFLSHLYCDDMLSDVFYQTLAKFKTGFTKTKQQVSFQESPMKKNP